MNSEQMYRIFTVFVTGCIFIFGCGGPAAQDLQDLEMRVSVTENVLAESTADEAAKVTGGQLEILSDRISLCERNLEERLSGIQEAVANLKQNQESLRAANDKSADVAEASTIGKLQTRIDRLESELATIVSQKRSNLEDLRQQDAAGGADAVAMQDDTKKQSRRPKRNRKDKPFEITLFSWNVESEGSDPKLIAKQLSETNRYDVYALCEVLPESIELYTDALGQDYRTIASRSGFNDRLQIIYNAKKFELLRRLELREINFEYRYRSPLVAHLRDRATNQQVMVMNNHLARGRAEVRTQQAKQLVEWARDQNIPIVAVGDYNFDYVFSTRKGNDGFDAMLRDNIWRWVEPVELIDTNWFDNPKNPDGKDDYEGSMLDFAFVAGAATEWEAECRVIVSPGDFPDDETTSDHRPFELRLSTK